MINWPEPGYIGETYTSPNGNTWIWNGYGWNTLGSAPEGGNLLYIEVQPDPSDIRALPGQSFELLPSPGRGKYLDIVKIICESDAEVSPATSAYNYVTSDGLYFSYETSSYATTRNYIGSIAISSTIVDGTIKGEISGTAGTRGTAGITDSGPYLWMGDEDSFAIVVPYGNDPSASIFKSDKGLYVGIDDADNDANNATVGNHLVTFKIFYRINEMSINNSNY